MSPPPTRLFPARSAALLLVTAALSPGGVAEAAPPPNDGPPAAAEFSAYGAANGRPRDLQGVADLAEATADAGVPRCLGPGSFERTAWFRVPAAPTAQEIAIDAIGRTLDLVDLAAFVQPASGALATSTPNACAGAGAGGAAVAEEAASGLVLRVAAGRSVLVQVGRRGLAGPPGDERALLSLDARALAPQPAPAGDAAGAATPVVPARRSVAVPLAGAMLGDDDPAQPACPSPASVWRRIVPGGAGTRLVSVEGRAARSLTVFSGGGPGGFDPTPGGAGGGLPAACEHARASRARVTGPRLGRRALRGRSVRVVLRARRSALCDVRLRLVGPGGSTYATARAIRLAGRRTVRLRRERAPARGRYRLRVEAVSELGRRIDVRSGVRGRLR